MTSVSSASDNFFGRPFGAAPPALRSILFGQFIWPSTPGALVQANQKLWNHLRRLVGTFLHQRGFASALLQGAPFHKPSIDLFRHMLVHLRFANHNSRATASSSLVTCFGNIAHKQHVFASHYASTTSCSLITCFLPFICSQDWSETASATASLVAPAGLSTCKPGCHHPGTALGMASGKVSSAMRLYNASSHEFCRLGRPALRVMAPFRGQRSQTRPTKREPPKNPPPTHPKN